MKEKLPSKKENTGMLEEVNEYIDKLLKIVKKEEKFSKINGIKEQIDYLEETNEDIKEALKTATKKYQVNT